MSTLCLGALTAALRATRCLWWRHTVGGEQQRRGAVWWARSCE